MATTTFQPYTGNGSNKDFNYSFPTFTASEVVVEVDGVVVDNFHIVSYSTTGTNTVRFDNGDGQGSNSSGTINNSVCNSTTGAPLNNKEVIVRRDTNVDNAKATFTAGSSLKAADLTDSVTQILRALQEEQNTPTTTPRIRDNAITNAKIADDAVDTAQIANGAVTQDQLGANSVRNAKIADDQIDSRHYVGGSIDEEHIANSAVTSNKIADNAVTTTEILNGAVTRAKLEADIIDGTKLEDNAVNTEHYTDGSIERIHLEADIVDGTKIADNAVDHEHIAAGAVRQSEIATNAVGANEIIDGQVNFNKLTNGAVGTIKIADDAVTADKIADAVIVTNSEQAAHSVNDTTFFTTSASDARYFNISSGDTIKDGDTFPDNDTTIATTAAINDRIIDLIDDVGGFVPIANQNSFPQANPDLNDGGGTIVSVKTATTALAPQSGTTLTLPNGRGGGNAVIITGVTATIPQDFGFLVETTTTDHTYAFHRLVPKATEVTTVAGKATEIGRLGTADAVADMAILGTADVVADLNTLGTADVVSDMNTLAVSDVISDMNTLAVTSVINNMDTVATNVANVNTTAGSISNVNTTAGSIANVNTTAGSIANVNTTAGSIGNVNTVAGSIASVNNASSNLNSINNYGDQYQVASNNPSTDGGGNALAVGDLYFNTSANELKIYNGSSWQAGVTATGNFALTTGNTWTGDNRYNDGVKALFGTGSDLQIYHNGSNSFIDESSGTGRLIVRSSGLDIKTENSAESMALFNKDGSVELFYDNSKKLETTSAGATLTGNLQNNGQVIANLQADISSQGNPALIMTSSTNTNLRANFLIEDDYTSGRGALMLQVTESGVSNDRDLILMGFGGKTGIGCTPTVPFEVSGTSLFNNNVRHVDSAKALFGTGNDLEIYHDGTNSAIQNSTGHLYLYGGTNRIYIRAKNDEDSIVAIPNGAVELYYDNSKKAETDSFGFEVFGEFRVGGSHSHTHFNYQDGGNNYITQGDSSQTFFRNASGTVRTQIQTDGHWRWKDNIKAEFGDSDDLQFWHDGTNSNLKNGTGDLYIRSSGVRITNDGVTEHMAKFFENGAVELYHNNSKKFETLSAGASVTGHLGIGTTSPNKSSVNAAISVNGSSNSIVELCTGDARKGNIYTDGTNMFLTNNSTGYLQLSVKNTETAIKAINDGAVELYFDNSKKLETKSYGVKVEGDLWLDDSNTIKVGSSGDLQIYHDGSNSYVAETGTGELRLTGDSNIRMMKTTAETLANFTPDANCELFYDNSKKFETASYGVKVEHQVFVTHSGTTPGFAMSDGGRSSWGSANDLQIYHDGTNSHVTSSTGQLYLTSSNNSNVWLRCNEGGLLTSDGSEYLLRATTNGSVKLFYDNVKKLETASNGIQLLDELGINDNKAAMFGDSDDMKIYHNGSDSFITNQTGTLKIQTRTNIDKADGSEHLARFVPDGEVELYYNGSAKFATRSGGVTVFGHFEAGDDNKVMLGNSNDLQIYHDGTYNVIKGTGNHRMDFYTNGTLRTCIQSDGHLRPASNDTYDLGTSVDRWRNIYTADLQLSNKGKSNDVDGTWGDYTMQEGENDLFLINNRSGRKYKFNLTEVS